MDKIRELFKLKKSDNTIEGCHGLNHEFKATVFSFSVNKNPIVFC